MRLGGGFIPPFRGGGVIPSNRWFYPRKGVVFPPMGSFWRGGYHPFVVVSSPFSVIFSVNLEPQYRKTSYMLCCKEKTFGDAGGACPTSISGMEVGEVMEGQGTTYGFTLSFLLHIALCICVRMPDLAGDNFTNGVSDVTSDMVWVCYSSSSTCIAFVAALLRLLCLLCYVICCWWHKTTPGWF